MTEVMATPPRFAQALAGVFLRDRDVDSVTGDLLEEYRERRRATFGRRQPDVWYVAQVLSIVGHVVWPAVAAVLVLRILAFRLPGGWNPSLVPSPGTSTLDALILMWAAYHGAKHTGRMVTGILSALAVGLFGFGSFFAYALVTTPSLVLAPFETPFVIVIFFVVLGIALAFAVAAGMIGAAVARWTPSAPQPSA